MPQKLRQFICSAQRHDFRVKCQPGRIFLRCEECGKETRGWNLESWKLNQEKKIVKATVKGVRENILETLESALALARKIFFSPTRIRFW